MVKRLVEACVDAGTCAVGVSHYAALLSALASLWTQVKHQLVATSDPSFTTFAHTRPHRYKQHQHSLRSLLFRIGLVFRTRH